MKLKTKLAGVALAALIAGPIGAAGAGRTGQIMEPEGAGTPGVSSFGNITHIKNIGGWSGSDIEFTSKEVVKLSNGATGDPVCKTMGPDGVTCEEFEMEIRDFAVAGGLTQNARVIDVTVPAQATVVSQIQCAVYQNDIQIQGDLVFVAADSGSGSCKRANGTTQGQVTTAIIDFKDPRNPVFLSKLTHSRGSHNHTVMPGKPYIYLSDSDLASAGLGNIPIYDISNPAAPVLKTEFKHLAHSPHDITFNADGTRAYAAAVSATYILNTENPIAPTVIATIANEGISISHQSDPTPDGDYLLVSDELGGGSVPGASPGGPVHVYDIRNEAAPVKVGVFGNDCVVATCDTANPAGVTTAHVFRINPDGYTMAIAWYEDGIHVVDFSDVRGANVAGSGAATLVGQRVIASMKMPGANAWSAKMWQEKHPGFVFVNDINRGLDIFFVPELGPNFVAAGTVHAGNPAVFAAGAGVTKTDFETNCEYSPVTNGVDGWVAKIPASLADGEHSITSQSTSAAELADVDVYFYDKDCMLLGASEETGGNGEMANVPAGTMYVLSSTFIEGPARIMLTSGPALPE